MEFKRALTREINIGGLMVGGNNKIAVQSMTNTDTANSEQTIAQIRALADAGCDIVRVAVYNKACLPALKAIKAHSPVPIVADVHFDYKLALGAIENGADKLRINPGNINNPEHIKMVADCARAHKIPIRAVTIRIAGRMRSSTMPLRGCSRRLFCSWQSTFHWTAPDTKSGTSCPCSSWCRSFSRPAVRTRKPAFRS